MAFKQTLTADGQSAVFRAPGSFRIHLIGTFGGGTLTLQQKIDNTFEDLQNTDATADSDFIVDSLDDGGIYRFDLSGATAPSIRITVFGAVEAERVFV